MAFDIATIDEILKKDYRDPVREELNSGTVLTKYMKRQTEGFQGLEAVYALHTGRNTGVGARAEHGTLPTAGNQNYTQAIFTTKYNYGRIQLSGPSLQAARNNIGAFVRGLQSEVQGLTRDIKVDFNRQLWHDGSSVLTRCKTTTASVNVEVESTKFLKEIIGAKIDILVTATGATSTGVLNDTIVSVTDADTFVINNAVTTDATFSVFRQGNRIPTSWGVHREVWGLEAALSDANPGNGLTDKYGGIERTGTTFWDTNIVANGGTLRDLDLDLMQQAVDLTDIEGDSVPGLIVTNHAIKRRYAAQLQSDKRYPPGGEITLDGGYKALEFNGTPLVADRDASLTLTPQQLNRMYFLTMSTWELLQMNDWDWMMKDGATLARVSNQDDYEATMFGYFELVTVRPNANAVLTDLKEVA